MNRTELRLRSVTYCDVCGEEIIGNHTSARLPDGQVLHAHDDWSEARAGRCSDRLSYVARGQAPSAAQGDPEIESLLERVRELEHWHRTGVLKGDALQAYARAHWEDRHDALQMAEADTTRQALRYLAQAAAAAAPRVAQGA